MTIYSLDHSFSYLEPVCCSTSSSNCCFLTCVQVSLCLRWHHSPGWHLMLLPVSDFLLFAFFFFNNIYLLIYGCVGSSLLLGIFSSCSQQGPLAICGPWVWLPHSTWDLTRPGIEHVSPALTGRFFTTEPPGKQSEGRQNENHNLGTLTNLITWTTALSDSMKLWAMPCRATQDGLVMVESSDKTQSTREGNGKPLQYSCLENPMNSMKKQKDRTWTPQVGRGPICYWRSVEK